MSVKDLIHNKWTRLVFWSLLYIAWVIWLGSYWWLLGLIVIFDSCITRKVKWTFWKKEYKEGEKPNVLLDWLDAIIFAVVVVTFINIFWFQSFKIPSSSMESSLYTGDHLFVSKLKYGPRVPQTPLTIPFTHNVLPGGSESYSTLIQNDYRRLKGLREVRRGDVVVFGFPNGDTVMTKSPSQDYYAFVRTYGRDYVNKQFGPLKVRPTDKKDHYVKRCVAIAGDTLSVVNGVVYIDSKPQEILPGMQNSYTVVTTGQKINPKTLESIGINVRELYFDSRLPGYPAMPLTAEMVEQVAEIANVSSVDANIDVYPPDESYQLIFPYTADFRWTRDNYGPIWIPQKGAKVELTMDNLPLYERIISVYESNELQVKDGNIYVNGEIAHEYTFKQDYFWMMGDNRHNSLDSRYWGFVPEDHVVGTPTLIWLSTDENHKFPKNVRWRRFLKFL
ncbi:MAG: signal peptidase I [Bacteroidales bacterium]|nr:signal peptidase I [Candidatus Cryptobacteroides caccocaballi]